MSNPKVRAVPEGMHTITPHLVIHGAAAAIDFYKKALAPRKSCACRCLAAKSAMPTSV